MGEYLRKYFVLFLALILVYGAYALSHFSAPSPHVLGAASELTLFEEPQDGRAFLLSALDSATAEIDVEVYLLSDADIVSHLLDACGRGVIVKVLLEQHPFGGGNINQKTYVSLNNTCVRVSWTNPIFALTHAKTIIIDGKSAFVLSQNLTTSAFEKNREYDILDTNVHDVSELKNIFVADWERSSFTPQDTHLLISPISSRTTLEHLLSESTKTLSIEMEVIDDQEIVALLQEQAKKETVKVILPTFTQLAANKKIAKELAGAGVQIRTMSSPYVHAKLILTESSAYIGSVNLTTQSMDQNREIGILLTQPDILANLEEDFSLDWENAQAVRY